MLNFDIYGLYNGELITYDKETDSIWFVLGKECRSGELKGKVLKSIPVLTTTWKKWLALHPDTLVLDDNTKYNRFYNEPARGGNHAMVDPTFTNTITNFDKRLKSTELILSVEVKGKYKAYVLSELKKTKTRIVEDKIDGEPIVIFYDRWANTASCFTSTLENQKLKFTTDESKPPKIVDTNTNSEWDITGKAISGKLKDKQLQFVNSRIVEWYVQGAYFPDTEIYQVQKDQDEPSK